MTITFTPPNGELQHDQSSGLQKDDLAFTLLGGAMLPYDQTDLLADNDLPDDFENFLEGLSTSITSDQWSNAIDYGYAYDDGGDVGADYFLTVSSDEGESVTDLHFSDNDGELFDGDIATYDGNPIYVAGETDPIYLYSFDGGDILIGSTQAPGTVDIDDASTLDGSQIVFAYYLEETVDGDGNVVGADIWGVTFQPIEHFSDGDDSNGEYDDAIDFGDFLHVTAEATLSFSFDTLESGKFLWVAVGDDEHGLLVTGKDLHVQDPGHSKEGDRINGGQDPSDAVNTSQGGQEATIGINNQLWVPGNEGVFTLVRGFTALGDGPDATGNNVNEINYDDTDPYINTHGAGIFISQTQGNAPIGFEVEIFSAGVDDALDVTYEPEEGFGYIDPAGTSGGDGDNGTSPAFEDDLAVDVKTVSVYDENMQLVAMWDVDVDGSGPVTKSGITVEIDGNWIDVSGLSVLYTVKWTAYEGDTFNRFTLEATEGKFDVGKVLVDEGVKITQNIGEDVLIYDDGPSAVITDTGIAVVHDESGGAQNDPLLVNVIDTAGNDISGAHDLSLYFGGIQIGDTLSINGETVFTYGAGNDGVLVSDLEAAIDGLDAITDADIGSGDLLVTRLGSTAVLDFEGAIATGLGLAPSYANADNDSDLIEDENDDDQTTALPGIFTAGAIGWAMSAEPVVTAENSDFGTDGAGTEVWTLGVEKDINGDNKSDVDSGLDSLDGYNILLNVEGDIVVGRVDADNDGDVDGGDQIAIAISLSQAGFLSVAQYIPISHAPDAGADERVAIIDGALVATLTVTDADGDFAVATENIGDKVIIEDDGPVGQGLATATLEEDDLDGAAGTPPELSTGNHYDAGGNVDQDGVGDGSGTRTTVSLNLQDGISSTGVDTPVSYSIDPDIPEGVYNGSDLPDLYSKGEQLTYVVDHGSTDTDPDTITAYADYGGDNRVVWVFVLTDNGDGTGTAAFTIYDQLDHAPYGDDIENDLLVTDPGSDWDNTGDSAVDQIDFTDLLLLKDADGDKVGLGNEFVTYAIQDDKPIIAENLDGSSNPISDGFVDFTSFNNPDDYNGSSVFSVTHSLNGLIGTDENDDSNEAGDGTKTYTFASYTGDTAGDLDGYPIEGLTAELSADGTTVTYFVNGDSDGNDPAAYDGNDTRYFSIVLDQDAGTYTFTVHQDPPPAFLEFDFTDLPSGQNLHGTIAVDKTDPSEGGLLLFPKGAILDDEGVMTTGQNASPTTNTSKGGGPVTIGNSNQMFDPGEGHYFVYVDNPDAASIAGVGLDQNTADDADTVGFDGTLEVSQAEVEIVQVQGGGLAGLTISAFDLDLVEGLNDVGVGDNIDPRDFITGPELFDDGVDIVAVWIYDATDSNNLVLLEDKLLDGTQTVNHADIEITFDGTGAPGDPITASVTGIDDDYVIRWETDGVHDMALIEADEGKYDIGGFNLMEAQPTPDQTFDYTVTITDFDGDTDTSNEFTVLVDGTGIYDDDGATI